VAECGKSRRSSIILPTVTTFRHSSVSQLPLVAIVVGDIHLNLSELVFDFYLHTTSMSFCLVKNLGDRWCFLLLGGAFALHDIFEGLRRTPRSS
jgi:hypothetical protein